MLSENKPAFKIPSLKNTLLAVCLCILVGFPIWYWYRLPELTWEHFLVALEEGNITTANSYCDQISFKVESFPGGTPDFRFYLRQGKENEWSIYFPIQAVQLRKHYRPETTSVGRRLQGIMPVSKMGSIYYGQLEIHQNKISFVTNQIKGK